VTKRVKIMRKEIQSKFKITRGFESCPTFFFNFRLRNLRSPGDKGESGVHETQEERMRKCESGSGMMKRGGRGAEREEKKKKWVADYRHSTPTAWTSASTSTFTGFFSFVFNHSTSYI
jgi:hypothetical protein